MKQYENSFRKLIAWQEAKKLTLLIYNVTRSFPKSELYGIVSQLRRSSSSIMANIAEWNNRKGQKDKLRFMSMAQASLAETDCFSELSFELNYLNKEEYEKILGLINRSAYLLNRLVIALS